MVVVRYRICFAALLLLSGGAAEAGRGTRSKGGQKPVVAAVPASTATAAATPTPIGPATEANSPSDAEVEKAAPPKKRGFVLGVALDLYTEFSNMGGRRIIDVAEFDESFSYSAGPLALRSWAWFPWLTDVRWGIGAGYREYSADSDEMNYKFGQLFDINGQIEVNLPDFKKVDFALEGKTGMSVLLPGGDFDREITSLRADGINVMRGPRLGWQVGAGVVGRYPLNETFRLFSGLTFEIGRIYLFRTKQTVENIHLDRAWTNEVERLSFSLGVEASL